MQEKKKGFFNRLVQGLSKTRNNLLSNFESLFSGSNIDEDFYEELEEILIMADIGIKTSTDIIDNLKEKVEENNIKDPKNVKNF